MSYSEEIRAQLAFLELDPRWLDFGYIDADFLAERWRAARAEPREPREHHRTPVYARFFARFAGGPLPTADIARYLELVAAEVDGALAAWALSFLGEYGVLTPDQFALLAGHPLFQASPKHLQFLERNRRKQCGWTGAPPPRSRDRFHGCLVGGAIGDALGGVRERPGVSLSDDTQMTLATCEALCAARRADPAAIATAFARWYRGGRFTGLGASTTKSLRDLAAGAHWALAGRRGEMAAGNGAAMRIAPLAFVLDARDPLERRAIRDACRITHHSDEAYVGALAVLLALQRTALPTMASLAEIAAELPDTRVRDQLLEIARLSLDLPLEAVVSRFGASGFVAETVPLALLVAARSETVGLEELLEALVQAGGDTDTIGSIAGQIIGAHVGYDGLPERLRALPPIQEILPAAEVFAGVFAHREDRRRG